MIIANQHPVIKADGGEFKGFRSIYFARRRGISEDCRWATDAPSAFHNLFNLAC